jgi:hypothetical protein
MRPGDLVRLCDYRPEVEDVTVGNLDVNQRGWVVPNGTIALVTKVITDRGGAANYHILIDGKVGWIYEEDCEVFNETR